LMSNFLEMHRKGCIGYFRTIGEKDFMLSKRQRKYNEPSNVAIFELKDAIASEIPSNIRSSR